MRAWLAGPVCLLLTVLVSVPISVPASHEPLYKAGTDVLEPGRWEAHFVWLQDANFNFMGEVWWRFKVLGAGAVDVLFLDWSQFQRFRDDAPYETVVEPLRSAPFGAQWSDGLTHELPYVLVFRHAASEGRVTVLWQIMAEIDWRRWQGKPSGPALDLHLVHESPVVEPGGSWEMRFPSVGLYLYRARPLADMTALLEVVGGDGAPPLQEVRIENFGFRPEILRVTRGSVVRWTNHDPVPHVVEVHRIHGVVLPETPAMEVPWLRLGLGVAPAVLAALLLRSWILRTSRTDGPLRSPREPGIKPK